MLFELQLALSSLSVHSQKHKVRRVTTGLKLGWEANLKITRRTTAALRYKIELFQSIFLGYLGLSWSEMEYCVSTASMLAEEIWQIAEGFVEVPVNLLA